MNSEESRRESRQYLKNLQSNIFLLQRIVIREKIPVLIILEGLDGSGKGAVLQDLLRSLDPRYVNVFAFDSPEYRQKQMPFLWRYWVNTPPGGLVHIFHKSWYHFTMEKMVKKSNRDFSSLWPEINAFEKTLAESGILVIKLWLNISRAVQKERLREEKKASGKINLKESGKYKKFVAAGNEMIKRTQTALCPWYCLDADDLNQGRLEAGKVLIAELEKCISKDIWANLLPEVHKGMLEGMYNQDLLKLLEGKTK